MEGGRKEEHEIELLVWQRERLGLGGDENPPMVHGKANAASLNDEATKIVTNVPILRNGLTRLCRERQMGNRTSGQTDPEGYLSGHRHDRSCSSPFNVITFLNRSSCGREGVHFHFQKLVEGDEAGVCCSARRQDTNEEDQDTGRATLSPRAAPPMPPRPTVIMFVIVRFSRMGHPPSFLHMQQSVGHVHRSKHHSITTSQKHSTTFNITHCPP